MRIPRQIKIGGSIYKIVRVDNIDDGNSWAEYDAEAHKIKISKALVRSKGNEVRKILLHEILHALLDVIGKLEISSDESLMDSLSFALDSVLSDNPKLIEMYSQKEHA